MPNYGRVAPAALRRALTAMIHKHGIVEASRMFDLSRETLAKVANGDTVTAGTLAQVRERLRMSA